MIATPSSGPPSRSTEQASCPLVSIIVPCRNEEHHIRRCLDSILASEYPADRREVLVADGMSDDATREIVAEYATACPAVRLLDNPERSAPAGLNAAIRQANGEVIVRVDAHAMIPPNYLTVLVAALQETGADNVGALLITLPANRTPTARAIAIGMSHGFGVGNSYFRIGTSHRRWVDTVPFGCYRRSVFDRIGLFDEELIRNQDDEFNFRLIARGGRILLLPDVECYYYARGSLRQLARMFYQYGYFKPMVARKVGRVMTGRQLVPAGFVLTLLGSAAMSPWWSLARGGLLATVLVYGAVVAWCAARVALKEGVQTGATLLAVFPVLHFGYGWGFLRGIVDHVVRPRKGHRKPEVMLMSR